MPANVQPTAEQNEYLALREAKIARNEQRLRDLGLLLHVRSSEGPSPADAAAAKIGSSGSDAARKRRTSLEEVTPPLRRSPRLGSTQQQQQQQRTSVVAVVIPYKNGKQRKPQEQSVAPVSVEGKRNVEGMSMSMQQVAATLHNKDVTSNNDKSDKDTLAPSNAARSIRVNVQKLISAPGFLLGVPLSSTGKAFVMQTSVQLAASSSLNQSHHTVSSSISFNKYSGIQEWAGNAVYLWVNLHAPQNEVLNEFTHRGRQVTFYGGSRMQDQSPIIQKLKLLGVRAAAQQLDPADGIVLWCRLYETCRKAFGPYVCLGRLSLVSYDPTSQPLRFVFQLLDYDTLMGDSQKHAVFANLTGLHL